MPILKTLDNIIGWLLYTSLFAACCAVGLCMATERLLLSYMPVWFTPLHYFVFGSSLIIYNTHALVRRSNPQLSDLFDWSQQHRIWHYLFLAIGLVLSIAGLWQLPLQIWKACAVLGLLSFMYSLPLLPFKNKKRIKDFGWIKILVLTGVWTIVTSILPILDRGEQIADFPYEVMLRFAFMFTLCIAFDIRDMQIDLEARIFTLPNLIGYKNSYRLMDGTLILFVILSFIQYTYSLSVTRLVGALLSALVTKWALTYTRRHPSDRAYLGLVDGMMLLYAILVLIH